MADQKDKDAAEDKDDRAAFEQHQREVARKLQIQRIVYWLFLSALPVLVAIFIAVWRVVFETSPSPGAIAIFIVALFLFRFLAATSVIVEVESKLVDEIIAETRPIERWQLARFMRKNLDALIYSDIIMAPLLVLSIALAVDLIGGDWFAALVGAGWFICAGLFVLWANLKTPQKGPASMRAELFVLAVFLLVLPALLNMAWSPDAPITQLIVGTWLRIAFAVLAMCVVMAVLAVALIQIEHKVFAGLLGLLPARRGLERRPVAVRNLVAFKEIYLLKEVSCGAAAAVAVSAVMYWIFSVYPSHWIFVLFNASAVAPTIFAMLSFSKELTVDSQRFFRRLSLQSAAVTLILVNFFLAVGYGVGFQFAKLYVSLFADFGGFP